MRYSVSVAVMLLAAACTSPDSTPAPATAPGESTTPPGDVVEVLRVFDGDSFVAELNGREIEVRLIGINAPEGSECHGDAAGTVLEALLAGQPVTLVADDDTTDQFGRDLRYAYAAGVNVNLRMIESGNALALQSGHPLEETYVAAGDAAAEAGLGMWSPAACAEEAPSLSVAIDDYSFDPAGPDEVDLNGEWVSIGNHGSLVLPLDGWILRDESSRNRFVFPSGFSLEPGGTATVRTGCGDSTRSVLYWCANNPVWSNGGDTVILQTARGTAVARVRYDGSF